MSPQRRSLYKPADLDYLMAELRRVSKDRVQRDKPAFWQVLRCHLRNSRPARA